MTTRRIHQLNNARMDPGLVDVFYFKSDVSSSGGTMPLLTEVDHHFTIAATQCPDDG